MADRPKPSRPREPPAVGQGGVETPFMLLAQGLNVSDAMNAVCDVAGYQLIEEVNSDGRLTFLIKPRG